MASSYDFAANLSRMIEEGVWLDGQRLPPERQLSEEFGLARNTVRRALKALEENGRLVRHVGRGTFVRLPPGAKANGELLGRMEQASPADVMEVRLTIEPQAAMLAAGRATSEDLKAIEQAYRQSIAAKGVAEFEHWDAKLHLAIFRATRNALLIDYCEAINTVRQQPQWYRLKQRSVSPETRSRYDQQHGAIVAALRDRDADAARTAMHRHLVMVRDRLLGP